MIAELDSGLLPAGIRSRFVPDVNGLRMHLLEAGWQAPRRPLLLLLHGFPELAYSWRKVMVPLAEAGFHVVAPDQRGYGRTTGWDDRYDGDVASFRLLNLVRDALGLVFALGHRYAAAVIGHDFGSPVAACCALARPDVFRSLAMMSAPFAGPPDIPFGTAGRPPAGPDIHHDLAALERPRKHYQWYFSTREADRDLRDAPEGLHQVLRAYYHVKSGWWAGNDPHPLKGWSAPELARLPTYYVMDHDRTMPETVRPFLPSPAEVADPAYFLSDGELAVYAAEFGRTGFQGGLNWYRCATTGLNADLQLFSRRRIEVPATFIAGRRDWGIHQKPGDLDRMRKVACARFGRVHLVKAAGHWLQQESPTEVVRKVLAFLGRVQDGAGPDGVSAISPGARGRRSVH